MQEIWSSWESVRPTIIRTSAEGVELDATAGRDVRPLGGEHLTQNDRDVYPGAWACVTDAIRTTFTTLETGHEYQVYLEVRVVADDQSAAQLHLLDEGVDLDTVTGDNGTIIRVASTAGGSEYEAIDVSFPAEYLQDQFDEILVSEPFTVRIPDSWNS